jgi:hypothetical protein
LSLRIFVNSTFSFEAGISTFSSLAILAFLILVSISAIGSVIIIAYLYQLDFVTPGIWPFRARVLKQILQIPGKSPEADSADTEFL